MADAHGVATVERADTTGVPRRLWQVDAVRLAVFCVILTAAGWAVASVLDRPEVGVWIQIASIVVGSMTFVPSAITEMTRGRFGISLLMTIAAVGAVALGQITQVAILTALFAFAQGVGEHTLDRTGRGGPGVAVDRLAGPLLIVIILAAAAVGGVGLLLGDPLLWIGRGLAVLVAAAPCALALSRPITVLAAVGAARDRGVLISDGAMLDRLARVDYVALSKTGILTKGRPEVMSVVATGRTTDAEVLAVAAAVESQSDHPLARAVRAAAERAINNAPRAKPFVLTQHVSVTPGQGLTGTVDGRPVRVGRPGWINVGGLAEDVTRWETGGDTVILVERADVLLGAIILRDEPRAEAGEAISELTALGVSTALLTGENPRTARAVAAAVGIGSVHAALRGEHKAGVLDRLRVAGASAMVGDVVHDRSALASAEVSIAAVDDPGVDVVITQDLRDVPSVLRRARLARAIIRTNVRISVAVIAVLVPLAAFGLLGLAAIVTAHVITEIVVIANALRASGSPPASPSSISDSAVSSHPA